jgi:hypothetical protein
MESKQQGEKIESGIKDTRQNIETKNIRQGCHDNWPRLCHDFCKNTVQTIRADWNSDESYIDRSEQGKHDMVTAWDSWVRS